MRSWDHSRSAVTVTPPTCRNIAASFQWNFIVYIIISASAFMNSGFELITKLTFHVSKPFFNLIIPVFWNCCRWDDRCRGVMEHEHVHEREKPRFPHVDDRRAGLLVMFMVLLIFMKSCFQMRIFCTGLVSLVVFVVAVLVFTGLSPVCMGMFVAELLLVEEIHFIVLYGLVLVFLFLRWDVCFFLAGTQQKCFF